MRIFCVISQRINIRYYHNYNGTKFLRCIHNVCGLAFQTFQFQGLSNSMPILQNYGAVKTLKLCVSNIWHHPKTPMGFPLGISKSLKALDQLPSVNSSLITLCVRIPTITSCLCLLCLSFIPPSPVYHIQWVPEITHHCPKTPFLLVGTQIDLRDDAGTIEKLAKYKLQPITFDSAKNLAKKLKAVKYLECSALTQKGLKNVFDEAILAVLEPPEPPEPVRRKRCTLM